MRLLSPGTFTVAFAFVVQFMVFLRWLHRRLRNDEVTRVFVQDIATNHLPHIYEVLERLCSQQGIAPSKPPTVRWVGLKRT